MSTPTFGHCKDCKHWEHHEDIAKRKWSTCAKVDDAAPYQKIGETEAAIFAEAHDDSGLWYGLKTGAMFGCTNFHPLKK